MNLLLLNRITLIISIISLIFFKRNKFEVIDESYVLSISMLAIVNSIMFLVTVSRITKTWLRFDLLFVLGFLIVHFQVVVVYSIWGIDPPYNFYWIDKTVVNYGTWLSCIVLLLWMLGFLIRLRKNTILPIKTIEYKIKKIRYFDMYFLVSFLAFVFMVGSDFWSGNHAGSSNWESGATYIFLVFRTILFLNVIYFFINNKLKLNNRIIIKPLFDNKLLVIISLIYILTFLFQGDRGPVLQLGLLIFGCYSLFAEKISFIKIFSLLMLGAFLFTIIGLGRTNDVSNREGNIFSEGFEKMNNKEDFVLPTSELAWSGSILYQGLTTVPDSHPYLYGYTIINDIIGVIPMSTMFYKPPKTYKSSTSFFTYLYYGPFASWGVGSEIIADLYINFGLIITLLVFFIFGYFMSYVTTKISLSGNYKLILIYLMMFALSIYINRSIFFNPLKFIFYLLIFDFLLGRKISIQKNNIL